MKVRVEAALQSLPGCFREAVVLREIEGFGYEEIAEILDVTVGTVKSRLARGRAALREALTQNAATDSAGFAPMPAPATLVELQEVASR